jgi:hypothetical protein
MVKVTNYPLSPEIIMQESQEDGNDLFLPTQDAGDRFIDRNGAVVAEDDPRVQAVLDKLSWEVFTGQDITPLKMVKSYPYPYILDAAVTGVVFLDVTGDGTSPNLTGISDMFAVTPFTVIQESPDFNFEQMHDEAWQQAFEQRLLQEDPKSLKWTVVVLTKEEQHRDWLDATMGARPSSENLHFNGMGKSNLNGIDSLGHLRERIKLFNHARGTYSSFINSEIEKAATTKE